MVKVSSQQKPIRILQQGDAAEPERKKRGRKPTKYLKAGSDPDSAQTLPDSEPQQPVVKKPRGRRPKNRAVEQPVVIKEVSDAVMIEEPRDSSLDSPLVGEKQERHISLKFDQLDKDIDEIKVTITNQVEQLRHIIIQQFALTEKSELSNRLLSSVRNSISAEVSRELTSQFEELKTFFADFKIKRITKDRRLSKASKSSIQSRESFREDLVEQPSPSKKGRKKKVDEQDGSEPFDLKKNLTSTTEAYRDNVASTKPLHFTFTNLEEPFDHLKSPQFADPEAGLAQDEPQQDEKSKDDEMVIENSGSNPDMQLGSVQTPRSIESQLPVKKIVETHVQEFVTQVPSENRVVWASEQVEETKSVQTVKDQGASIKTGQDFDTEFDLNAFSLNN